MTHPADDRPALGCPLDARGPADGTDAHPPTGRRGRSRPRHCRSACCRRPTSCTPSLGGAGRTAAWQARDARQPADQGHGNAKEPHEARLATPRSSMSTSATSRTSGAPSSRPTVAASPTSSSQRTRAWPAASSRRHGRDARLQRARAAHPRVHRWTSASAAWPASTPARTRAILGIVVARSRRLRPGHRGVRRATQDPAAVADGEPRASTSRATHEVRRRAGEARRTSAARSGIFVDPVHCKGCAECVEVCARSATTR